MGFESQEQTQEEWFRQLFDGSDDGVWIFDEAGIVQDCNPAATEMLGYSTEEFLGMKIGDIGAAQAPSDNATKISQIPRSGSARCESQHRRKDGRIIDVEVRYSVLPNSPGSFVAFVRDVTEKKRVEAEREITLRLLKMMNRKSDLRRFIKDIATLLFHRFSLGAVGIRLRDGEDFPYLQTCGFSEKFVRAEESLLRTDENGNCTGRCKGEPVLECMCGNVVLGRTDSKLPFFTEYGTFWTNNATDFFTQATEAGCRARIRKRCSSEGYNSVALIPLKHADTIYGLLQLNDWRHDRFDIELIGTLERLAANIAVGLSQRMTEAALVESEGRFRALFEQMPSGVAVYSVMDGGKDFVFADINQAGASLRKLSRNEHIGRSMLDVYPGLRKVGVFGAAKEVWKTGVPKRLPVAEYKDNRLSLWVEHCVFKLPSGDIVSVFEDHSERQKDERQRARLEQQYRQAQKMESVGRLAGGVAHDLNNMLSPILGYSEVLLEEMACDDPRKEYVKQISNAGIRARDLVRRLLAFSRKQTLEFKVIDLNDLLENFEKLLRRTMREDIMVQLRLAESLPLIEGDVGQLEQVVMNLVVNAQDAMPDGGELQIETDFVVLDKSYALQREGVRPGQYTRMVVRDTGCGMAQEVRENIFEPFFTTKGKEKGTGLGLSTVYGIVKQHGGNIWVSSEPGLGTTFEILLPVSKKTAASPELKTVLPHELNGTETILLVEDDDQVRELARRILKQKGYSVLVAGNGDDAISLLDNHYARVDLLIADVVMPNINGRLLFERISRQYGEVKVLFMSGYTDDVIAHHGVMEPGVDFIQKPFSIQTLGEKIREVLDR